MSGLTWRGGWRFVTHRDRPAGLNAARGSPLGSPIYIAGAFALALDLEPRTMLDLRCV